MVEEMRSRKHCAKLQKYIQLNELVKFRSYVKRHSVDVVELIENEGNSLLHLSCKYGCEVILRYLLKCQANVLLKNEVGDLPIHVACQYMQHGHKHAETDLVLPLIRNNPSCLHVKNNAGLTARHLLQVFKDRTKPLHGQHQSLPCHNVPDKESSSHSDSESDSFEQKLAREMDDEYSAQWGIYEEDYYTYEQEYETWNAWADRMAKEHAARCRYTVANDRHRTDESSKNSASGGSDVPKISGRKRKLFEENMKKEHRQQQEQRRIETIAFQKLQYERDCIALYKPGSSSPIGYDDVSWPHPTGKELPLKEVVTEFLFGDLQSGSDTYRSYLRLQRIRWHPDRFVQRCGSRLKDCDRGKILDKVNAISQILNSLYETLSVDH